MKCNIPLSRYLTFLDLFSKGLAQIQGFPDIRHGGPGIDQAHSQYHMILQDRGGQHGASGS